MAASAEGRSLSGRAPSAPEDAWEKSKEAFVSYVTVTFNQSG